MSVDGEKSYIAQASVPMNMISAEVEGLFGKQILAEFSKIIKFYDVYEKGAEFMPTDIENANDIRSKLAATLVDKESRFMFAAPVDITVEIDKEIDKTGDIQTAYQSIIDKVRKDTKLDKKIEGIVKCGP